MFSVLEKLQPELLEEAMRFYLKKSGARTVYFANSSDGFKLHMAAKIDHTTWEVIIPGYGEFSYFYIIDNKTFLPDCRFKEAVALGR